MCDLSSSPPPPLCFVVLAVIVGLMLSDGLMDFAAVSLGDRLAFAT